LWCVCGFVSFRFGCVGSSQKGRARRARQHPRRTKPVLHSRYALWCASLDFNIVVIITNIISSYHHHDIIIYHHHIIIISSSYHQHQHEKARPPTGATREEIEAAAEAEAEQRRHQRESSAQSRYRKKILQRLAYARKDPKHVVCVSRYLSSYLLT